MTTPSALDEISGIIPPVGADIPPQTDAPVPGRRGRGRPRKDATAPASLTPDKRAQADAPMPPKGTIAKAVSEMYGFAGFGLMAVGRPMTAQAVMANAADCGEAWEAAAAQNPQIRAMLLALTKTSTYGVLVAAHAPIVMTALAESRERKAAKDAEKDAVPVGADGPEPSGRHAYSPASAVGPVSQ